MSLDTTAMARNSASGRMNYGRVSEGSYANQFPGFLRARSSVDVIALGKLEAVSLAALFALVPLHPDAAQIPPTWTQIGRAGEWNRTVVITAMNGRFWSVQSDGTMAYTTLDGRHTRYGAVGSWYGTTLLVPLNGQLFNVQRGTLYASDIRRGTWVQLDNQGDWARTMMISAMDGYLWSIERNGAIYRTDQRGNYTRVSDMSSARWFGAMGGKLWVIDDNATLWSFKPGASDWEIMSDPGDLDDTVKLAVSPDYIWAIAKDGSAWRVDATGKYTELARAGEYVNVATIIVLDGHLYAIRDGTLYRTR